MKHLRTLFCFFILLSSCGGTPTVTSSEEITSEESITSISSEEISSEESSQKSEYELFKEAHPDYYGTKEDYLHDLAKGLLEPLYQYDVVNLDNEDLSAISGSVRYENNYVIFNEAIVEMDDVLVLPVDGENGWNLSIKGIMNTSGEYLVSRHREANASGRVYFGINSTNGLFIGVNIDKNFHNYCFDIPAGYLTQDHTYDFVYAAGIFYLRIDGGELNTFATFNINQTNAIPINDAQKASQELANKIRAATGEYYMSLTHLGAENFTCKMSLEYLRATTSYVYNYKGYEEHPLDGKRIFQLGSSISYGAGSNGRSFVEQIASLTNTTYQKETVSGTTLAKRAGLSNSYVERYLKFDFSTNPDYLIVQLSTNDFVNNVNFGLVDDTPVEDSDPADFDQYTIAGAIEYIIAKTREMNENIKIYFYTCPIKESWGSRGKYLLFLNQVMPTIVEKWGIGLIDLFNANNFHL